MPESPSIAPPPVVSVTFSHGNAGDIALARDLLNNAPELDRVVFRERIVNSLRAIVFLIAGWGVLLVLFSRDQAVSPMAAATVIIVVAALLTLMWAMSGGAWTRYRQTIRAIAMRPEEHSPQTRVTIELGPRGMRWQAENNALEYGWIYFERVDVFKAYVVLYYAGMFGGIPIPRAAFASEEECHRFVEAGRQWLVHTKFDVMARNQEALSAEHARCGACGYSLAKLADARCPECGRQLTGLMLTCAEILARPWWKDLFARQKFSTRPQTFQGDRASR
jgi:hypothetical protein